jgi:hypothetical protein
MRVVKLVLICLLVVLVGSCARYLVRESRANSVFDSAQLGQSEASVVQQLGPPDEVLKCGEYLWWNGDQENPPRNFGQCKKWVRYNFFLHAFAFGYSTEGTLVSRYECSSE